MEVDLENKINSNKECWLKKAFKEEWPTMANHLIAGGVSIGSASGFSHYATNNIGSDAAISGITTAIDMISYWVTFTSQLIYRDKKHLLDENGKIDRHKALKKTGEYLGYIGFVEGTYAIGRFWLQYHLQKHGWDPATASAIIQSGAMGFFTFILPPVRYAIRKISEK